MNSQMSLKIIAARTILKYSFMALLASYVYLHILHLFGILYTNKGLVLGYFSMFLMAVVNFFFLKEINLFVFQNKTPFFKLLFCGLALTSVSTILYLSLYNLELHVFHTYPHQEYLDLKRVELMKQNLSDTQIENELNKLIAHYYSLDAQIGIVKWYFYSGTAFTLLTSAFLLIKKLLTNKNI